MVSNREIAFWVDEWKGGKHLDTFDFEMGGFMALNSLNREKKQLIVTTQ